MIWLLSMASRNARRNKARTLVTAAMVVVGTALVVVALSWIDGVMGGMTRSATDAIGHVRVVAPDYARREALMPLYENIPEVEPVLEAVLAAPGVRAAHPRIAAPVALTAEEEIGEVFGLAVGADEDWFRERLELEEHLAAGTWFTGGEDDVLLGRVLARRLGVEVGDEIRMLGQTQDGALSPLLGRVVGITSAGNALIDQQVFVPYPRMEWMVDLPGGALEILVYGDDHQAAGAVADRLRALPALEPYAVQTWTERPPWDGFVGLIGVIRGIMMAFFVGLAALGVLNTMMMSVLERTSEIGVLRAMGLSRLGAVLLFLYEGLFIAVLGGAVGAALGSLGGLYIARVGIPIGEDLAQEIDPSIPISTVMYGDLTWEMIGTGFLMGLAMAVVGTVLPALRAAAIQPVAAMRSGR